MSTFTINIINIYIYRHIGKESAIKKKKKLNTYCKMIFGPNGTQQPPIIKLLHQTAKTDKLTKEEQRFCTQARNNLPGFEYTLWTDNMLEKLAEEHFPEILTVWKDPALLGIQRADIGRYMVLAVHGGLYIDTDMEIRREFLANVLEDYQRRKKNPHALYVASSIPDMPSISSWIQYFTKSLGIVRKETYEQKCRRLDAECEKVTNYILYAGTPDAKEFFRIMVGTCIESVKSSRSSKSWLPKTPAWITVPHTTGSVVMTRSLKNHSSLHGIPMKQFVFERKDVLNKFSDLNTPRESVSAVHMGGTSEDRKNRWNLSSFVVWDVLSTEFRLRNSIGMDVDISQTPFLTITAILLAVASILFLVRKILQKPQEIQ